MTAEQSEFLRFWKLGEFPNYIGILDNSWAPNRPSAFQSSESRSKEKKGTSKKDMECFNCRKKGHYARDCHGPRGEKEGQQPPKGQPPKITDSATNTSTSTQDGTVTICSRAKSIQLIFTRI